MMEQREAYPGGGGGVKKARGKGLKESVTGRAVPL